MKIATKGHNATNIIKIKGIITNLRKQLLQS